MIPESSTESALPAANLFSAADVAAILHERGWLPDAEPVPEIAAWLADAAALLGPHAADRDSLARLLNLIFTYDAQAIHQEPESHVVLARQGAREVVRELAHTVLDGAEIDSDRFKEIVTALKNKLPFRDRRLFHPIRLALAGRAGEGELDRVILLLDRATRLPFRAPVKGTRQRMLEFCAVLE
jgi:hypothetical protein